MLFKGGDSILEDCIVACQSDACIIVSGMGVRPKIERCKIHDGKGSGIVFTEGSSGEVIDCEVCGHYMDAIVIMSDSDPLLLRNNLHDCNTNGIYVHQRGKGRIEANDIYMNKNAGIKIADRGDPTVINNSIRDGLGKGIDVSDEAWHRTAPHCT